MSVTMTVPSGAMKHLASTAALVLCAMSAALAQSVSQSPPADPQSPDPSRTIFRTGSELVRVDVRVTDDQGRPITDLRPGEVKLEEEGAARPIVLFQHIEAPRGTYTEAAQRTIGAEVSTNQGAPQGHIYVLVFDEVHIRSGHEQKARLAAEKFLRAHVRAGDRVALYALPGPGPQIAFTADVGRVLRELPSVRGTADESSSGLLASVNTMGTFEAYEIARGNQVILDRQANQASQNLQATDTRNSNLGKTSTAALLDDPSEVRQVIVEDAKNMVARADGDSRRFLVGLADVVRTLRSADGRKAVILFSEGFQTDNVTRELEDVAAAAAQSYSVIYAMDLNPRTIEASENAPRGGEQLRETQDKLQSLGSLTAETAGTLVLDAPSQIDQALARIANTSEDYYLLGFTPANPGASDRNRYRHIRVTVSRPGTHVSARTGYALEPKGTPADRRRTIDAALQAPFGQKGLAVEYTTYTLRGSSAGVQRVIMCLSADLPAASASVKSADVVYVVRDTTTGKVMASGSDQLALPEASANGNPNVFRVQFEVPPGTYLMRALVREPGGLVGSADRRFQVRALNGPDVTASDLVVGSSDVKGLPVRASAYTSDLLGGVFEVYGRTESDLEGLKISAELVPVEGGSAVVSGPARLQPTRPEDTGFSRGVRVELPLSDVAAGQYLARASVRHGDETVAELLRDVTVKPGPRPATESTPPSVQLGFEPQQLLTGDVTRHLFETIQIRAKTPEVSGAAKAAIAGNWDAVASAVPADSVGPDLSVLRGSAAYARRDYATAITAFRAAQAGAAHDPAIDFMLGWAFAANGDDRAAISAWRSSLVGDATLVPSYLALVDAYLRLGQRDLALQVVKSGLTALPSSPELLDRLARLENRH